MIVIPWSALAHDNHRLMPVKMGHGLRLIATPDYRLAKAACEGYFLKQWHEPMLVGSLAILGTLWFPDARKRDAGNYRKCLTDAMTGIVYSDDSQLHDERWIFGGIDREQPRVELEITIRRREG